MAETYYEEYLKKKDTNGKWRRYWVLLNTTGLFLYYEQNNQNSENVQEVIELTSCLRCVLAKRRMYSFRFKVITEQGSCVLKCDSVLQRYRWMYLIGLVVKGSPPEMPPNVVPRSIDNVDGTEAVKSQRYNDEEADLADGGEFNHDKGKSVKKSSSFTRTFSFKNIYRNKRKTSLPTNRCLPRKIENKMSNPGYWKTENIHCSFNFAENKAFCDVCDVSLTLEED